MLGGVAVGAVCALMLVQPPRMLSNALAFNAKPDVVPPLTSVAAPDPDAWSSAAGAKTPPAPVKTLAVTQLMVPARSPECDTDLATTAAPNGEAWPEQSGYIPGYPLGNNGREMTVVVDNSANASPVFVKIYDLERNANVRHAYVLGNGMLTIDGLAAGKYEVRYQNVVSAAARAECASKAQKRADAGF
jgi:hypothetical protein